MKKLFLMLILIVISNYLTGCMSYLSYTASKNEVARNRIYASGDKTAIRLVNSGVPAERAIFAVPLGKGDNENFGVGLALDLTAMDAVAQHPWRQLAAGVADAAAGFAIYYGVEQYTDNSNDSSTDSQTGNGTGDGDVNNVIVDGDGNTVNVSN